MNKEKLMRSRMKFVLAEGKLPPAETGKIFGFLTPIDPYTDTFLKRRIRTAHKIGKKNQSINSYSNDIELQKRKGEHYFLLDITFLLFML